VSYSVTQPSMKEPELKVGGLQKQTVNNCGSLEADPMTTKLKKHQILDDEIDRLEEQLRHMRSVRHGQRIEPSAVSLHDNRTSIGMIPRAVARMESVERGQAGTHVAAIAENYTSGAHAGSGNVINQMTAFPSVSTCSPNECLASASEYTHGRQPTFQRFGYTLDRNADGHDHKRSEHDYRGRSFHRRRRAVANCDGDDKASASSYDDYDDDDDGRLSSENRSDRDDNENRHRRLYCHRRRHRSTRSPVHGRNRFDMKPERFNGNGSFETFLIQFENCVAYNRWSTDDKVAHLRWSLTGAAAQLLWGLEFLAYEELLEKLRCRFSGKGMKKKFQTELRCCRRNQRETLRELAQDIRRLMTLAYPGEKSTLAEHIARDAFLVALGDPEFELKIREREPANLDDALRIAQRFEVFKGDVESRTTRRQRLNRHVFDGNASDRSAAECYTTSGRSENDVTGSCVTTNQSRTETVAKRREADVSSDNKNADARKCEKGVLSFKKDISLSENDATKRLTQLEHVKHVLEQQMQKLVEQNESLSKEVGRLSHLNQLRAAPLQAQQSAFVETSGTGRRDRLCFLCGEPGHIARACPRRGKVSQSGSRSQQLQNKQGTGNTGQKLRRLR